MDTHLPAHETALLVVDVQPRLLGLAPGERADRLVRNVTVLVQCAQQLHVPVVFLEQDPAQNGATLPGLVGEGAQKHVKHAFSGLREDAILHAINALARRRILVCGMQAHLCAFFTARDLVLEGFITHVARDAVFSLRPDDELAGLELMRQSGAILTTMETAIIDWLGRSTHPAYHDVIARLP